MSTSSPRSRPVPGWYDDPERPGTWRWWDGQAWARPQPPPPPPPGWYADPWAAAPDRWWDGQAWTGYTGPPDPEPPWLPPPASAATRTGIRGGWIALGGFIAAVVLATGLGIGLLAAGVSRGSVVLLVVTQAGLWSALLVACLLAVRRHGHGSLRELGLSGLRRSDLGVGVLASWIGRLAAVVVVAPLIPLLPSHTVRSTSLTNGLTGSTVTAVVLSLIVAVGAPFFEELFFRGLVQGVFTRRFGPRVAIVAQAACFAVAHYEVGMGVAEALVTVATIGTLGAYLGLIRWRYGRLGPGMVAHAAFNLFALIVVFAVG